MARTRVRLVVEVDLDPIPGAFHTPEGASEAVESMLTDRIPHYDPMVVSVAIKD